MSTPEITDRLPVSLRAYAAPQFSPVPDAEKPTAKAKRPVAPASSWTLIFDAETAPNPGQALRFGTYQFRNGDELDEAGIFYDPDGVTPDELETLRAYATANGLELRTRESFVDDVFFARAYVLRATIVGFNLPFDISRLAICHATARTPVDSMASAMHGGLASMTARSSNGSNSSRSFVRMNSRTAERCCPFKEAWRPVQTVDMQHFHGQSRSAKRLPAVYRPPSQTRHPSS